MKDITECEKKYGNPYEACLDSETLVGELFLRNQNPEIAFSL